MWPRTGLDRCGIPDTVVVRGGEGQKRGTFFGGEEVVDCESEAAGVVGGEGGLGEVDEGCGGLGVGNGRDVGFAYRGLGVSGLW